MAGVTGQFSQGGFESSSSVTDVAIDGRGFFRIKDANDGSVFFSRSGQFNIDKDGFLVNPDGYRVQGFTLDETTNQVTSNVDDIVISTVPVPPSPSDDVSMSINLDSNGEAPAAFSLANPTGTSNFSAGVTVYDSLGNDHLVSLYFRKNATNSWQYYALVDGGELTTGTAGNNVTCASGTFLFDTDGGLYSVTETTNDFDFMGATQSLALSFNFGTSKDDGGTGLDGITQFGSSSTITNISQDGYASGSLKSIEVDADGTISGNYTNGTTQVISQLVVCKFNNEVALKRVGSNNYVETLESGAAVLGAPGSGGNGTLVSSTLEQSNVDLANELIRMVVIQRGFQANSRTITTINDLLAQLVTLGQ
ncbi:MAG: hypothetical protein ACD_73C00814G0009 [uncultured bacterium]|nr:MAG: hypothetical protein ACD_73C00814G0009 [uncultured bacterium]